jgi:hypothetical protein
MGKVATGLSMSLDGFIAGPNDCPGSPLGEGGERLFAWYSAGDTEYRLPGTEMVFEVSTQSAELLREAHTKMGAFVTGRRTFDITKGWGGNPPWAYRPSSSPIRSHKNGSTRDRLSRSSRRVSRAPWSKRKRLRVRRTLRWGRQASCSNASGLLDEIHVDLRRGCSIVRASREHTHRAGEHGGGRGR